MSDINASTPSNNDTSKPESKEDKKKARQRIADAIARSQAARNQTTETTRSPNAKGEEKNPPEESINLRLLWRVFLARVYPSLQQSLKKSGRTFWKNLRDDIWTKLAALIIAIVIWLVIGNPADDRVEATFFVPINATGLSDTSISRDFPAQVTIRVQGMLETIDTLDSTAFHAFIDLHNIEGNYLEPVHITSPTGVRVLQQDPQSVAGTVELLQYRSFPIDATVLHQEDGQYTRAFATPSDITALGAEKDIARIASVLVMVTDDTEQLAPQALDSNGNKIAGIHFNPEYVKVRLQRENIVMTKRIPITLNFSHLSSQLNVDYTHLSVNEVPLSARYEAARANLHALEELKVTVDVAGYGAGLYSLDVPLELPEGVSLMGKALTLDLELIPITPINPIEIDALLAPATPQTEEAHESATDSPTNAPNDAATDGN